MAALAWPKQLPRLIGVIHLPPLPGAPLAAGLAPLEALTRAGTRAVKEAQELEKAGFEGLILENFGDVPFGKTVGPETVAAMSLLATAVRETVRIPVGVNVLRNDARAALAIATMSGCEFIRVNVLSGVAATDQGWIEGQAAELLRERARLQSPVRILADVLVKHARTLSSDQLDLAMEETFLRAGADALIVTGATTGRAVDDLRVQDAATVGRRLRAPVFLGSGVRAEGAAAVKRQGLGVIVGSDLRRGGRAGEPLEAARLAKFVKAWRKK